MRKPNHNVPDEHIFFVCERFFGGEGATSIANWLKAQSFKITREQVYDLVRKGIKLGYVQLCPPQDMALTKCLQSVFPQAAADIQVLDVEAETALEHLTMAAAEKVVLLIKALGKPNKPVHIGLGAGRTTKHFARDLALRLRSEPEADIPKLVIHALTSGFSPRKPSTAPVAFFSFFEWLENNVEYVGMFSEPFVPWEQYDSVKKSPGVREAFEDRDQIDIVVSSLSDKDDPHGLFREFISVGSPQDMDALEDAALVGDVQWHPFSDESPIMIGTGIRPVTLFELDDLVKLSSTPDKHVIVISGPCVECGTDKSRALLPLMKQPSLRVFNHLVTDTTTARELLEKHAKAGNAGEV